MPGQGLARRTAGIARAVSNGMVTKFRCEAAGRYRSADGRTSIIRGRGGWEIHHGDVVGPRAFARTLFSARLKANLVREGWDALDDERNTLRLLKAQVKAQERAQ